MENCFNRRLSRKVKVGDLFIGGDSPITIQSMTNTDTRDVKSTVNQIKALEEAGCEIVRVAIPDIQAAEAVSEIKKNIKIPLVTDIHFDYRLALKCIENGADKIRINPGNIGQIDRVRAVANAAKERNIPIRIGVNAGSLDKHLLEKYQKPTADALVESAFENIKILEQLDFENIVVSLKASSVPLTIRAYQKISEKCDYPLHVGVTEAGTLLAGSIKSAAGIGSLLTQGIGDTIRVSLTSDPINEIVAAKQLLKALEIRAFGAQLISCPTCGRCRINLIKIAEQVEEAISGIDKNIKVAVMGCVVNGPGEARDADIGVAGGDNVGMIFKKGEPFKKVKQEDIVEELLKEISLL